MRTSQVHSVALSAFFKHKFHDTHDIEDGITVK